MSEILPYLPAILLAAAFLLFRNQTWWPLVVTFLRKIFPPAPGPAPDPGKADWQSLLQEILRRIEAKNGTEGRLAVEQALLELDVKELQTRIAAQQPVNSAGAAVSAAPMGAAKGGVS